MADSPIPGMSHEKDGTRHLRKITEVPLPERRNWLIHQHYIRRDFDVCKALIREQVAESKGFSEYPLYIQALILRHEGKIPESMEMFQTCALMKGTVENLKQVAKSLQFMGRLEAAADIYNECLKMRGQDWACFQNIGVICFALKRYDEAKQYLNSALTLRTHPNTFKTLAEVFMADNDAKGATTVLRRAVEEHPANAMLSTKLGLLYMQAGMFQKSLECLGAALSADAEYVPAVLAAGSVLQTHGDYDVALGKYRIVSASNPDSPALWSNIGMCFYGKKKFVAAVSCLKRANYLAPFDWKILYNLGLVHLSMQQSASAFHFLSAAAMLERKNGQLLMLLGMTLKNLQDWQNAAKAYESATQYDTTDPIICLNYAMLLYEMGDQLKASKMLAMFAQRVEAAKRDQNIEMDNNVLQTANRLGTELSSLELNTHDVEKIGDDVKSVFDGTPDEENA